MYTQKVVQSKHTLHVAYITGNAIYARMVGVFIGSSYSSYIYYNIIILLYYSCTIIIIKGQEVKRANQ